MVENVAPKQTWEALDSNPEAQLVDVRTDAEWNFVGVPDLHQTGKRTLLIP
jgi:rhodanese-related sulfurtransferase